MAELCQAQFKLENFLRLACYLNFILSSINSGIMLVIEQIFGIIMILGLSLIDTGSSINTLVE